MFREIEYCGEVVGFISLKRLEEKRLSIEECYILPEFRHNNLLYRELLDLASIPTVYLYARRPNWAFMNVLMKNDLVENILDNVFGLGIGAIVDSEDIYVNDELKDIYDLTTPIKDFFADYVYDMDNRLLFLLDVWGNVTFPGWKIAIIKPRLSDLNKINYNEILLKFNVKYIDKISRRLSLKYNNIENCFGLWETKLWQHNKIENIIGKPGKLNPEMIELLNNRNLDESIGFDILNHIKDANKKVQLKDKYNIFRRNYLLENPEMIQKEVNLNLYDDGRCPFCENEITNHENCIYCGFDFENIRW